MRGFLQRFRTRERFDLILIDVDHSPDDRLETADDGFYTEEGPNRLVDEERTDCLFFARA